MNSVLVAYFSAEGTTRAVAERLAEAIGADLFAIEPKIPYTAADLDWTNKKSRSSLEMNDPKSRPAVAGKVENMKDYRVIFLGFPVWWYREPSIINTFVESYNLAGKTIVPFCTSGGSPIGKADQNIQALAPEADVVQGKRFAAGVSASDLKAWASAWL